jgi:hypothetical protein
LGEDYDMESLNAVLATAAAVQLPGDPPWLLVISGSGNAKTETVQSLIGIGAIIVSTISSEGALLSASSQEQKAKNATGGLLRQIGAEGILVIKDFTSILSASHDVKAAVLAALREVHDGRWVRTVGTDGGKTLVWEGRIVVIAACTTAWDDAHMVVGTMGDRFAAIRVDSSKARIANGLQALRNTGKEGVMRQELADAVAGLLTNIKTDEPYQLTGEDEDRIVAAADLVTRARTGVKTDCKGVVSGAHAAEAATRLSKELVQILRGAMAIGMEHGDAMRMVIRCARDSMPPERLEALRDVAENPESVMTDIMERLQRAWSSVNRMVQALQALKLVKYRTEERMTGKKKKKVVKVRLYSLADGVDIRALED